MKVGKSYTLVEFLGWTRRKLYVLLVLAIVPVVLYQAVGLKWIAAPWAVAALLGTAASFIVGFKNAQTYNRTVEAQQVWTTIASLSRYWGLIARDFPRSRTGTPGAGLPPPRVADGAAPSPAPRPRLGERDEPVERRIPALLPGARARDDAGRRAQPVPVRRRAARAGRDPEPGDPADEHAERRAAAAVREAGARRAAPHRDAEDAERPDRSADPGGADQELPVPAPVRAHQQLFVWSFAALLPFCLVREFDRLNDSVGGMLAGHMAWLAIPFCVLVAWMYVSLDQVGESTENPFEGGANDVPISQICRLIEIELREMLGETALPRLLSPRNQVIL